MFSKIFRAIESRSNDIEDNNNEYLLWQTNSEGNDIDIIDIKEKKIIQNLEVGPNPHGIAFAEETNTLYVTLEFNDKPNGELIWINAGNFKIKKRIKVDPEPHEIEVTPNGEFIYVPCRTLLDN